jgi:SulP family sulfate permease
MGFTFYDWRKNARGDFFGGLNAAIVAIPLAMAFGVESGLGAAAGLIGAFVLCTVASLVGGTPLLVSGPTAPMAVVSSIIVANTLEKAATLEEGLSTIFVIFFLAGAFQVLLGLLRVGQYIRFAPYPLISGFMSGMGLLMITLQIFPLLGEPTRMHIAEVMGGMGEAFSSLNGTALALGLSTILVIYLFPKLTKAIPSTLVALVVVSGIAYFLPWKVPVIGDIPNEWMEWKWSHVQDFDHTLWKEVLVPSLTLALIGSVDTLLTSLVADMVSNTQHRSNRELLGQGLGNMLSALTGGLPGSGATMRTVLNIRSGARTRWSALIHSAFLLLVLLEVSQWISHIPLAVLAGILITVGLSIIDYKGLGDIRRIPKADAVVILVVLLLTFFVGILQAFAAGIVLASLFFVKKMADKNRTQSEPLALVEEENEEELTGLHPTLLAREIYIQEFSGPLFFGFASYFKRAFLELPYMRAVIFRMEHVPFIDHSGIVALGDVLLQLKNKKVVILLVGLQEEPEQQLRKMNIIPEIVKEQRIFPSFSAGADWLVPYLKENPSPHLREMVIQKTLGLDELNQRLN